MRPLSVFLFIALAIANRLAGPWQAMKVGLTYRLEQKAIVAGRIAEDSRQLFAHPGIKHPMSFDGMVKFLDPIHYKGIGNYPKTDEEWAKWPLRQLADDLTKAEYRGDGVAHDYLPKMFKTPGMRRSFREVFGTINSEVLGKVRRSYSEQTTVTDTDDDGNPIKDEDGNTRSTTRYKDGEEIALMVNRAIECAEGMYQTRLERDAEFRFSALEEYFNGKDGRPSAVIHEDWITSKWTGNRYRIIDEATTYSEASREVQLMYHDKIMNWVDSEFGATAREELATATGKRKTELKNRINHDAASKVASQIVDDLKSEKHLCKP